MKYFILFLACSALSAAITKTGLQVTYTEATDVFELMDNVSKWHKDYTDAAYRTYWEKRFGINEIDREFFKKYAALRKKYFKEVPSVYDPAKRSSGLFSSSNSLIKDPFARLFYASTSVDQGLKYVSKSFKRDEMKFLVDFYKHFKLKASELIKESSVFYNDAKKMNKKLKKGRISSHLNKVAKFLGVKIKFPMRVHYVWYPPVEYPSPVMANGNLLIRLNPVKHRELAVKETILEELAHMLVIHMPDNIKKTLSQQFMERCQLKNKIALFDQIQNPFKLVMGRMLYYDFKQRRKFDLHNSWTNNKWVNTFARLIHPNMKKSFINKETIQDGIVFQAADICRDLLTLTQVLK